VTYISAAVQEQTSVTHTVAVNISTATQKVEDANTRSIQMADLSGNLENDVSIVNTNAGEMTTSSTHLYATAKDLSILADEIYSIGARFQF
jgi:hypothetical protein